MKARVFVTLKPSVFDPQGHTIAEALHSLGYGSVGTSGRASTSSSSSTWPRPPRPRSWRPRWPTRAGQPRDRKLPDRAGRAGRGGVVTFAIVVFPGSNCDHDAYYAIQHVLGQQARFVWHKETDARRGRCRDPARRLLARRLPADGRHRPVLADHGRRPDAFAERADRSSASATASRCCSSAGLLPGAMLRNRDLKFHCEIVHVRVEQTDTPFTRGGVGRPGAAGADRARRRQLLRAARRRSPSSRPTAGRLPLRATERRRHRRGQSERVDEQHRRHLQRCAERRRADAASGAGVRGRLVGSADGRVMLRVGRRELGRARGRACGVAMTIDRAVLERHGLTETNTRASSSCSGASPT